MAQDRANGWWAGLGRSRKIMIAAIVLSVVSQFFRYTADMGGGMLDHELDTNYTTGIETWGDPGGSGWHEHRLAVPLLTALAIVYATDISRTPFWTRYGHWIAMLMLLLCTLPAAPLSTPGGMVGGGVLVLGVWSLLAHRKEMAGALSPADLPKP